VTATPPDDRRLRLLRPLPVSAETPDGVLVRETLKRGALSGVLFVPIALLGHPVPYALAAGAVFGVVMGGAFLAELLWRRWAARRRGI
jgi:hypothetical protein